MLFVIHATDKKDGMPTRAKFYRAHRVHLDQADAHHVDVATVQLHPAGGTERHPACRWPEPVSGGWPARGPLEPRGKRSSRTTAAFARPPSAGAATRTFHPSP